MFTRTATALNFLLVSGAVLRACARITVRRIAVAHALLRAASTLVSTLGRPCQTASVGTSADTARKSACATWPGPDPAVCDFNLCGRRAATHPGGGLGQTGGPMI